MASSGDSFERLSRREMENDDFTAADLWIRSKNSSCGGGIVKGPPTFDSSGGSSRNGRDLLVSSVPPLRMVEIGKEAMARLRRGGGGGCKGGAGTMGSSKRESSSLAVFDGYVWV